MKLSIIVQWPLLPLLLCPHRHAAQQLLRGAGEVQDGFVQPIGMGQPFGGQVPLEGNGGQLQFTGMQMPQQPLSPGGLPQLLQVGAPAPPSMASPGGLQQTLQAPSMSAADQAGMGVAQDCQCEEASKQASWESIKVSGNQVSSTCSISKVTVHQDHAANAGISLAGISAIWGSSTLSQEQREKVTLGQVSETSFHCLDDRVTEPSIFTPGGDLGEFILALSSYLQERDPTGQMRPSQEVVDTLLLKYLETIPGSRPMIHCTDDRAIAHLEAEVPLENLDLSTPPDHAKASLLQKLTEAENHGDSHMRLLLKKPGWFQLNQYLVPMAIKSFYHLLWLQNTDERSPLHKSPKLKLEVLVGQSDPKAFLEVSSGELCHNGGFAPMLTPRTTQRAVLISHLDAVSIRREELAAFFSRIANASPRKINKDQLHQRLDRHGWLSLETTGSRIAAGLPFYTLTYS